jgi:RNA polymerase sigma factor (sigma-70 family)
LEIELIQMNLETTDYMLWEDFRKGDKQALSSIYFLYVNQLYRYGKKFSTDDELIKDLIQDLFFDLIRTRSTLGSTDHIYFYLIKSLRRRLAQHVSGSRKKEWSLEDSGFLEANIVYSFEDELIKKEELSQKEKNVQIALSELSPKQREIIYYRYTCDFEYEQICELMSMKYDSARKMVFRALKSLRASLTGTSFQLFMLHIKNT